MMKQTGFSLIELLISLAISVIVLIGVSELYVQNLTSKRLQEMQSTLSQDGYFAINTIRKILNQAGYAPLPTGTTLASANNPWASATNGGGARLGSTVTVGAVDSTNANSVTVRFVSDAASTVNCLGGITSNANSMHRSRIFFASGKLRCTTDLVTATSPTVVDLIATTAGGRGSEVVDFTLEYGVDTASYDASATDTADYECSQTTDCIADLYTTSPTSSQLSNDVVMNVNVCLVLRSEGTNSSVIRSSAHKNCSNGDITDSTTDLKIYRTFRTTVKLRNRTWSAAA